MVDRRRRPGRPGHRDPPEAARRRALARGLGRRAREGLGARRAHPVGRDHGPARDQRAVPRLEGEGRAAQPAGHRRPVPVPDRDRRHARRRTALLPECFRNDGNYVISLGNVMRWLAQQAEGARRRDLPGLSRRRGALRRGRLGARRGHRQLGHRQGRRADRELPARHGAARQVHDLRRRLARQPRPPADRPLQARRRARPAELRHRPEGAVGGRSRARTSPGSCCTPRAGRSTTTTYGGSFLYHLDNNQVALGFVVGLDYDNPYLSPFEEFQRWKTHPEIRKTLEGGKRLGYGARAITAGGMLSLPKTVFPGGAFVGCEAGYLNSSRIKGSHAAIKTGMLAAEAAFDALVAGRQHDELVAYPAAFKNSWLHAELQKSRNFKQWFKKGFARRRADDRHRAMAAAAPGHPGAALDGPSQAGRSRLPQARRPSASRSTIRSPTTRSPSTACRASSSATPTTRKTSRRT